jgi:hypothetical protein
MIPLPTSECPQLNMKETSCPLFVLICTDPKTMKEHITTLLSSRVMRLDSLTQNLSDHILPPSAIDLKRLGERHVSLEAPSDPCNTQKSRLSDPP